MKTKGRPGPKLTDPPHLIRIKTKLEEQGLKSINDAYEDVKKTFQKDERPFPSYDTLVTTVREGLPSDPRESLLAALRHLSILEILESIPRRASA